MAKRKATKKAATKRSPTKKTTAKKTTAKKPEGNVTNDFTSYLDNLEDSWEETREKEPTAGGSFGPNTTVFDCENIVLRVLSARLGVFKKSQTPYISFKYEIADDNGAGEELVGEQVNSTDTIDREPVGNTGKTHLDLVSERLQRMGVKTKGKKLRNLLTTVVKEVTEHQPLVWGTVKNTMSTNQAGEERQYQNVYINGPLSDEEISELEL